jgi:hypothetical protein
MILNKRISEIDNSKLELDIAKERLGKLSSGIYIILYLSVISFIQRSFQ